MNTALSIDGLSHIYGSLKVLEDISLTVNAGEFVSIVGPSGCGKSTLLKIIAGLIEPQTGVVQSISSQGVSFQDANLLPWLTVEKNVSLPLLLTQSGIKDPQQVADLLRSVRLTGFEHAHPYQLSGGMKQRVAIARALSTKPDLLLMDEPFGALDELTREEMNISLLRARRRQNSSNPAAVLFVTHSIAEAVFLSDRVITLSPRPGRIEGVVDIPLPRPRRNAEIRNTEEFHQLVSRVRSSLHI